MARRQEGENLPGLGHSGHRYSNITVHGKAHLGDTYVIKTESSSGVEACRKALFLGDPVVDREALKTEKGRRTPGTCEWIKSTDAYRAWIAGAIESLSISGGPGKGKTVLSMFLTEDLEAHTRGNENSEVLFYFCAHQDRNRNSSTAILRSLVHQLLTKREDLFPYISSHFEDKQKSKATVSSAEALWIVLRTLLQAPDVGHIFCVLDGLDECDEASQRLIASNFCEFFSLSSLRSSSRQLRLAIVSRPIPGLAIFAQVRLDPDNDKYVHDDVRKFISSGIGTLQAPGFNKVLRRRVEETLLSRAQGTFLWIGFVLRDLSSKSTCTEIMETVDSVPSGLHEMYARMLRQIDANRQYVVSKILRWVTLAIRPLTPRDLAAAIHLRAAPNVSIDQAIHDHIVLCGPIVKMAGKGVTLVHQSAKDYLLRAEFSNDPILQIFHIQEEEVHAELTTTCLDCIERSHLSENVTLQDLMDEELTEDGTVQEAMVVEETKKTNGIVQRYEPPLLSYAIKNWPGHARSSYKCLNWTVQLKRGFFNKTSPTRRNWAMAYLGYSQDVAVLHLACWFGIQELVHVLVSKRSYAPRFLRPVSSKTEDEWGETALFYAVRGNWQAVAELLLKHGANVNAKNRAGHRPIMHAIGFRDTAMVQLLLNKGAKIDARQILLQISFPDEEDVGIIKLLIKYGADVNVEDSHGRSVLSNAAYFGQAALVRVFLQSGARIDSREDNGHTALWCAITSGNEATVQLLIDHGADVNERYDDGSGTLEAAAGKGHSAIVRLLLQKQGPKVRRSACRKALHVAVDSMHTAAARVLLKWGVDPRLLTRNTVSLVKAAKNGNEELVRLFIEYGADVNVTAPGSYQTPLQAARNRGHTEVVRLLESASPYPDEGPQETEDDSSFTAGTPSTVSTIPSIRHMRLNPHLLRSPPSIDS